VRAMERTGVIRLGGLLATIGGVAFLAVSVSVLASFYIFGFALNDESYLSPIFALVLLAAIVAVASVVALYVREIGPQGWLVLATALVSFIGLGILFYYSLTTSPGLAFPVPEGLIFLGALLATLGLVALGIVVISVRGALPWWCVAALIAGSPLSAFLGPLAGGLLIGVAWALVGFATFRAGAHQAEQPSRVR
jgi:hypothetical protein